MTQNGAFLKKMMVWPKAVLFCGVLLLVVPIDGSIKVTPNGVLTPGTTVAIRITLPRTLQEKMVQFSIMHDENGNGKADEGETPWLKETCIKDGETEGNWPDFEKVAGVIELRYRLTNSMPEGKYILRSRPGPADVRSLAEGAAIAIQHGRGGIFSLLRQMAAIIDQPPPTLEGVRLTAEGKEFVSGDLWLMDMSMNTKHEESNYPVTGPLTESGECRQPNWSPDGKRIIYVRRPAAGSGDQLRLLTIEQGKANADELFFEWPTVQPTNTTGNANTSGITGPNVSGVPCAPTGQKIFHPVWSPDSQNVAFISDGKLWLLEVSDSAADSKKKGLEGRKPRELGEVPGIETILAWAKDGGSLVVSARPDKDIPYLDKEGKLQQPGSRELAPDEQAAAEIWQVSLKVKPGEDSLQRLSYYPSLLWYPYLAPGGQRVVFPVRQQSGSFQLWMREGNNLENAQRLTRGKQNDTEPTWSPDGHFVIFLSNRPKPGSKKGGK